MSKFKIITLLFGVLAASAPALASKELWEAALARSPEKIRAAIEQNPAFDSMWRPGPFEKHALDLLREAGLQDLLPDESWRRATIQADMKRHPERYFVVAPSSVPGESGFGLYLRKDLAGLRSLPAGIVLPMSYPGARMTDKTFEKLLDYIKELTEKYDADKNKPLNDNSVVSDLKNLKLKFGIVIRTAIQDPITKAWSEELVDRERTMIDWDQVSDQLGAYIFGVTKKGRSERLYLTEYSHRGDAIFAYDAVENFALSINEPPPKNFINVYTLNLQTSAVSVLAEEDNNGGLRFKTLREIQAGEELFLAYGPSYTDIREKSGYTINLSRENGAGMFKIVDTYLNWMSEDAYKSLTNLCPFLATFEQRDREVYHKYFNAVVDYRHDPTIAMRELNEDTLLWLSRSWGQNFPQCYQEMKAQLKDRQAEVTNYWVDFVNGDLPAQESLEKRQRIMSLLGN